MHTTYSCVPCFLDRTIERAFKIRSFEKSRRLQTPSVANTMPDTPRTSYFTFELPPAPDANALFSSPSPPTPPPRRKKASSSPSSPRVWLLHSSGVWTKSAREASSASEKAMPQPKVECSKRLAKHNKQKPKMYYLAAPSHIKNKAIVN